VRMTSMPVTEARRELGERFTGAVYDADVLPRFQNQLRDYFSGQPVRFDVDIDLHDVTDFQRRVLEACATIDYGSTLTYRQLAELVGRPRAARAVGNAMARNPLPLVIPCHRVVAGNGKLGGFSAEQGVALKERLLAMEAASASRYTATVASRRHKSGEWAGHLYATVCHGPPKADKPCA